MSFKQQIEVKISPSLKRAVKTDLQRPSPLGKYRVIIAKEYNVATDKFLHSLQHAQLPTKEQTDHYVFADLTPSEIDRAAGLPEVERIWPDEEGYILLDESAETIKAPAVWTTYRKVGKDICWAVVDSGIQSDHPHFNYRGYEYSYLDFPSASTVVEGVDFTGNSDLTDNSGHGTHVAGIIAGWSSGIVVTKQKETVLSDEGSPDVSESEAGQAPKGIIEKEKEVTIGGIAPMAKLVNLKVVNDQKKTYASWVIKALYWIRGQNSKYANIVIHGANISLGIHFEVEDSACGDSPVCAEVNRLVNSGVVVCVAAGNRGLANLRALSSQGHVDTQENTYQDVGIEDPGNAAEAITVGSTHKSRPHRYGVSYFSSKGPTGDGRLKPDLIAPGEKIVSCGLDHLYYETMSGTSMATPHVSGACALLLSVKPEFKGYPRIVKEVLLNNCVDLKRDKYFQGSGLLDIFKAISAC